MSEIINTYSLDDTEKVSSMSRDEFYAEQIALHKKSQAPNRSVEVVHVFIFNSKGEILLQKRSPNKDHNPGLIDKSLGGHITYGNTIDYTVMVETVQELQTPSIVLKDSIDFTKTHKLLSNYLDTISILKHIDGGIQIFPRKINGEMVRIANKTHVYLGVYDGRVRPADGEAQGVLWYKLEDLEKEMKEFPDIFTQDLHILFKEYRKEIEEFIKEIRN